MDGNIVGRMPRQQRRTQVSAAVHRRNDEIAGRKRENAQRLRMEKSMGHARARILLQSLVLKWHIAHRATPVHVCRHLRQLSSSIGANPMTTHTVGKGDFQINDPLSSLVANERGDSQRRVGMFGWVFRVHDSGLSP
jgi:hypothetical protein